MPPFDKQDRKPQYTYGPTGVHNKQVIRGIPLEDLHKVFNAQTEDAANVAYRTDQGNRMQPSESLIRHIQAMPPATDITSSPIGFGNAPRGQDPMGPTGTITNTYQPSPQAQLFGRVMEALQDPRNSWIGLGGIGRGARFFKQPYGWTDYGGFKPSSQYIGGVHPSTYAENIGTLNEAAKLLLYGSPMERMVGKEMFAMQPEANRQAIDKTMQGLAQLRGEKAMQMDPKMGGSEPSEMVLRLFGFEPPNN